MSTSAETTSQTCPSPTVPDLAASVGAPTNEVSEQELDAHIRDCGYRMTAAFAAGDRADADEWRKRMYDAIKSRSPEHQARMTMRIDTAIWFQSREALEMGKAKP